MIGWPFRSRPLEGLEAVALDLETSGLNPKRDEVLSVGLVPVRGTAIRLGEALYTPIRPQRVPAEANLALHGLLPAELQAAPTLAEVLPELERRIEGRVLIVHHAPMDLPFLQRALGRRLKTPAIDTLKLALKLNARMRFYAP